MTTTPSVSGIRPTGITSSNPNSAASPPPAVDTLLSAHENDGANAHMAGLRDRRSRAQLALAFEPPHAAPLLVPSTAATELDFGAATLYPNADAWGFLEDYLDLFQSEGIAPGGERQGGEDFVFGAKYPQEQATLMDGTGIAPPQPPVPQACPNKPFVDRLDVSARGHSPCNPGLPTQTSSEVEPIREPQTPDMHDFYDVDYPNRGVKQEDLARLDAAFSEAMGKERLSFGEHRMHPLLNTLCREIKTELGLEIQHPRLRMQFAILLASRLAKSLRKISSFTYLKDKPLNKNNRITSIINIRAYTYVAALLGFSGKKQEREQGEFQILRKKLNAGRHSQLNTAFDTFGAQGLHILLDLNQLLLTKPEGKDLSKFMTPRSAERYVNAASILLFKGQKLFEIKRGEMYNWVGNAEREEQVVAAAIADIQPRRKSVAGNNKIELDRNRRRFTSCLPHLREVFTAASDRVSIRDSHFENGRDSDQPSVGDKRKAGQAFPDSL
jgi:hypothetical protein